LNFHEDIETQFVLIRKLHLQHDILTAKRFCEFLNSPEPTWCMQPK